MKRFCFCFFTLILSFSILSCSVLSPLPVSTQQETRETKEEEEKQDLNTVITGTFDPTGFSAGFGRQKVTPPKGTPLAGYGNNEMRRSETVLDDLYATCIALSDGEKKALLVSLDNLGIPGSVWDLFCGLVKRTLGIEKEYIFVTATHTHSGPALSDNDFYSGALCQGMLQAAKDAVATLDRAEILVGKAHTENLNYVRRYFREDGTFAGVNTVEENPSPLARHETDPDTLMQVIRLDRANQKDILLVNWQCHVTTKGNSRKTVVSADWVGEFRKTVEKDQDAYFAYFQGAAGNLVASTKLPWEKSNSSITQHGQALAAVLNQALQNTTYYPAGKISATYREEMITYNRNVEGYDLAGAQKIKLAFGRGDSASVERLCLEYGYHSYYHAASVLTRAGYRTDQRSINLSVLSIGPCAFVAAPYEMFDTSGMQIRSASPFDTTFICAYTNGKYGYFPTREAFANGGYEVDTTKYVPGTAEQLVGCFSQMLQEIKK